MYFKIGANVAKGFINDDDLQKVRDATDIVALFSERTLVKQRGKDVWCCCPFHNEKTPSCKLDPATQLWHCFGCGEGGDIFNFVMKSEDIGFTDAVKYLADRANIDLHFDGKAIASSSKKQRLKDICKETAVFYHNQLMRGKSDEASSARSYLSKRGFGTNVAKNWELGFAPGHQSLQKHLSLKGFSLDEMLDANVVSKNASGRYYDRFFNRIMFPIYDVQGDCIAFGGRIIGTGEPKYLNSQETPIFHKSNVLYGLSKAKATMTVTGTAIVVEGYTDVIALHEAGITNVVATLGTALTMNHIRLLSKHAPSRIVYLFDGDSAGQRAADRALQFLDAAMTPEAGKKMIDLCAVTLPDNLDPADFIAQRGVDSLNKLLEQAQPLLAFGIERRLAKYDLSTAIGRSAAAQDAMSILAPIKDSILAKDYATQIANKVHIREADALDLLKSLKVTQSASYEKDINVEGSGSAPYKNSAPFKQSLNSISRISLSNSERSRLNFERVFLGLCAQNPLAALKYVNVLAKTNWHDSLHKTLAQSLVSVLSENPSVTAAEVIYMLNDIDSRAAAILTSAALSNESDAITEINFYAEELEIGDLSAAMDELRAKNSTFSLTSAGERSKNEKYLIEISDKLGQLRRRHNL